MINENIKFTKHDSDIHIHLSRKDFDDITITVNENHIVILSREPLEVSKTHPNKITLRFSKEKKTAD
jgi:hypothetical protein